MHSRLKKALFYVGICMGRRRDTMTILGHWERGQENGIQGLLEGSDRAGRRPGTIKKLGEGVGTVDPWTIRRLW